MPVWHITVDLRDLVADWKYGRININELARKVADRIQATKWRSITPYPDTFDGLLHDLKISVNEYEYRAAFEEIYDLADSDRVWIETS